MPEESADECGLALAWLTELLALNIKALHQVSVTASWLWAVAIPCALLLISTTLAAPKRRSILAGLGCLSRRCSGDREGRHTIASLETLDCGSQLSEKGLDAYNSMYSLAQLSMDGII